MPESPESSSPLSFVPRSYSLPRDIPRQSRYNFRHLQLLRQNVSSSPLRVIAHLDLDAFYAQCEMVRLGTPPETPLAVQQWESLIAINYAARPFGITRMISAVEAKKRCPGLVLQHVATFREGEGGRWAYRDDAAGSIRTDKVSLDPYRAESRKILSVVKEDLSRWRTRLAGVEERGSEPWLQPARLEKASIDEVFIDLSSLVFGALLQRFPKMRECPTGEERTTALPPLSAGALEWAKECALVDLDEQEAEGDAPDWDDVAMAIGSEIVYSIRKAVWEKLNYTSSAGIARNKMIAKLGSGCNKPNRQTIVRNRAVHRFLGGFKFTKIRMLGGKLGDQVTALFGTEEVSELLKVTLDQLKARLDDDTASWLYGIIRGEDNTEVNPRTQIKSMLSAKSFRPSINSVDQAEKWLRIFVADLYGRLVEDGLLENRRRPRTVTLHCRQGAQDRSRQLPIPTGKTIDEMGLLELSKTLLGQAAVDGRTWPCANLSLSVGGFEDGVVNNRAIDEFLVRGDSIASMTTRSNASATTDESRLAEKKRNANITSFFKREHRSAGELGIGELLNVRDPPESKDLDISGQSVDDLDKMALEKTEDANFPFWEDKIASYICNRCEKSVPSFERNEHEDWHFARDLEARDKQAAKTSHGMQMASLRASNDSGKAKTRGDSGRRGDGKSEKGQTRLAFG
ncbi:hypothetical protein Egran_01854 [Elaphomyces granulatus]|uniref:DNA polymerase eta n=1 Tax=Elaphomyces granulatus TaxID=519963 RepID=A0A232M1U4_9EURO|nr:hypothetical protein Egran_01854 [Elaphomyces granulatus]